VVGCCAQKSCLPLVSSIDSSMTIVFQHFLITGDGCSGTEFSEEVGSIRGETRRPVNNEALHYKLLQKMEIISDTLNAQRREIAELKKAKQPEEDAETEFEIRLPVSSLEQFDVLESTLSQEPAAKRFVSAKLSIIL
jgi:hypothetical protein